MDGPRVTSAAACGTRLECACGCRRTCRGTGAVRSLFYALVDGVIAVIIHYCGERESSERLVKRLWVSSSLVVVN